MIDEKKWRKYSFYQQMGNIASELSRAVHFEKNVDTAHLKAAQLRLIELVDLTIDDPKNIKRLKELCRFKEVLGDWYWDSNQYGFKPEFLKNYAMDFALSQRKG